MGNELEQEKSLAAQEAVKLLEDGMVVGAGSGSTSAYFVRYLGERVRNGLKVVAVPTSKETADLCQREGIPLVSGSTPAHIDVTVDGADQFDSKLRLIKGGGGALLREKIVASATKRQIIIADSSKKVEVLGVTYPLPIEVLPFAWIKVAQELRDLSGHPVLRLRKDGELYVTDQGNYILDCQFASIPNPETLAVQLSSIPGLIEHGLFIRLASEIIMGKAGQMYRFLPEEA